MTRCERVEFFCVFKMDAPYYRMSLRSTHCTHLLTSQTEHPRRQQSQLVAAWKELKVIIQWNIIFFLSVSFLVLDGEPVQESSSGRRINSLCGRLLVRRQRAALTVWRGHSTNPVRALGCQHTALLWGANHSTPVSYLSKLQNSFGLTSSSWPAPLSNSSQMSTANQIETGEEKGELHWWNEKTAH